MSELAPRVMCLTIPTPFSIGPVNVYLIEGEPLTLLDTGPRTEEAWQALIAGLASHGYHLRDIQRAVLSHAHLDHYGLLNRVVAESGAPVYTHARSLWWLTDAPAEWQRRIDFYRQVWQQSGVPPEDMAGLSSLFQLGLQYAESLPPGTMVHTVDEGDELTLGGAKWHVMYTPGHAASHISLYEPSSRQMMAGDHLLLKISSNPLLEPPIGLQQRTRSLVEYIASLQRVAAVDVGVAWPGHGPVIDDHRVLIAKRLAHHRDRANTIAELLADGPLTAYEVSSRLFPGLPPNQLFLGLSEVIGHLDILAMEGRTQELMDDDGVARYLLIPAL